MKRFGWLLLIGTLAGCGGTAAPASSPAPTVATSAKPATTSAAASGAAGQAAGPASTAGSGSAAAASASASASAKPGASGAAAGGSAAAKPSGAKIVIAYPSLTAMGLPSEVAQDTGIFARNGLNAEVTYIAGSPNAIKATIAGDVQFASVGSSAAVQADLAGANLVMVATGSPGLAFRIYARPEIKTVADLKGKRLVQGQIGSDTDFAARLALPRNGVAYSDVQYLRVDGNNPAELAAYKASGAESMLLTAGSFAQAEKDFGAHLLLDILAQKVPYNQAAMTANRDWVNSHTDETQRYVRSYAEGIKFIVQNRAQAIQIMKKYTKNDDDTTANEAYDYYVLAAANRLPYVTEDGVQSLLDLVADTTPAAKQHKPSDYIDSRFVDQLKTEGFSPS